MVQDNIYPEPRPIGELLIQITHNYPADYDTRVLAGAQLNDDDDTKETLASLHQAEAVSGNKMTVPEYSSDNFKKSGTEVEDFLAREHKVSTKELEDALSDRIPVNTLAEKEKFERQQQASQAAAAAKKAAEAEKSAHKELSIHFQADDIMDAEEVQLH